jgi:hypothetical protein
MFLVSSYHRSIPGTPPRAAGGVASLEACRSCRKLNIMVVKKSYVPLWFLRHVLLIPFSPNWTEKFPQVIDDVWGIRPVKDRTDKKIMRYQYIRSFQALKSVCFNFRIHFWYVKCFTISLLFSRTQRAQQRTPSWSSGLWRWDRAVQLNMIRSAEIYLYSIIVARFKNLGLYIVNFCNLEQTIL